MAEAFLSFGPPLLSPDLNLQGDVSLSGFGATLGSCYIQGSFPPEWASHDIQSFEL